MAQEKAIPQYLAEFNRLCGIAEKLSGPSSRLFYAAFAIASILLIASVFIPRPREMETILRSGYSSWLARFAKLRIYLSTCAAITLLMLCSLSQQLRIDERRGFIADQERRYDTQMRRLAGSAGNEAALRAQYLYMPEGESLNYMTLGNPSIAADYLWLTSLQYVSSSFRRGRKFEMLLRFYTAMMELDPHWIEAISNGGKVLSALERDRMAVEKYYMTASVNNPRSWRLRYECGRMFVVPPLNPDLEKEYSQHALDWFNAALKLLRAEPQIPEIKGAITDVEYIASRMAFESDYYEAADEMLYKQAIDSKLDTLLRSAAAQDWLSAHSMVLAGKIQKQSDEFKKRTGSYAPSLGFLLLSSRDPILGSIFKSDSNITDTDAFGLVFDYDSATGKVSSRGIKAKRALQAQAIVNGMINNYRVTHGSLPVDLFELQKYTLSYFASPNDPPTANITDALGRDLDVINSPLGAKWDYDRIFGSVTLPAYCRPENLFRNADKMLGKTSHY